MKSITDLNYIANMHSKAKPHYLSREESKVDIPRSLIIIKEIGEEERSRSISLSKQNSFYNINSKFYKGSLLIKPNEAIMNCVRSESIDNAKKSIVNNDFVNIEKITSSENPFDLKIVKPDDKD